jgi:hypothetical protein
MSVTNNKIISSALMRKNTRSKIIQASRAAQRSRFHPHVMHPGGWWRDCAAAARVALGMIFIVPTLLAAPWHWLSAGWAVWLDVVHRDGLQCVAFEKSESLPRTPAQ